MERASVSVGEPTSYDTTVSTFGELGRALTEDISKVFQQTGIPPGKESEKIVWDFVIYCFYGIRVVIIMVNRLTNCGTEMQY